MFCPILIGPFLYQWFHTKDGLDILLAHGHRPVRPVRPCLLFLSSSAAPFTPFGPSLLCKGVNWGDGKNNPEGSMFMGRRIDTYMNGDKFELRWRLWKLSGRWHNQYGDGPNFIADGDENLWMVVYGVWCRQVYRSLTSCRGIKGAQHVSLDEWLVSRIKVLLHLPCTPSIKTSIPLFISFAFRRNYIVRASPSPVRAYPFNSFSVNSHPLTLFLGKWFHPFSLLYFQLLWQKLKFLASVSPFLF